jgi:hypothetical protein
MRLTAWDMEKLTEAKLRPFCRVKDGRYFCIYQVKGNKVRIGEYTTLEACNAAWDAERERRRKKAEEKPRLPAEMGYSLRHTSLGTTYQAGVYYKGKYHYLGTFAHKELARARHVESIDAINARKFDEFYNKIKGLK